MSGTAEAPTVRTPVLIIGSSMVGMTLSALLAKHGVKKCITVEKHSSTAIHPRAALFHPRTMQICRELGLYERMKSASYEYYDGHAGVHNVESLAGKKLGTWMKDINEGLEDISPTSRMFLTQQMFEPLLREQAEKNGADLRFSTELVDFRQDEKCVNATLRDTATGATQNVQAQYMIACDGNRSFVRQKIGIPLEGHGLLSYSVTIYFKADLGRFVRGSMNGVIYVNNEHVRGFFRLDKTGTEGFLVVNTAGQRGTAESRFPAKDITRERAAELLTAAIGADVDFEITLLSPWRAVCDVAGRFIENRILLAGDAGESHTAPCLSYAYADCHIFPSSAHTVTPNGGFGGNTGLQDAHNLAWKLALVLQCQAGPKLIQSYEEERWPVAKKTIDQVFKRYLVRTDPELRQPDMLVEEEVPDSHLELGFQYVSRALTNKTLPNEGQITSDPAIANAVAGSMSHHVLIQEMSAVTGVDSRPHPIADLLGHSFVLVCGPGGSSWVQAARRLNMQEKALPNVAVHQLSSDPCNQRFYNRYALSPSGCVLIRPDGFVAWSQHSLDLQDADSILVTVLGRRLKCIVEQILCLEDRARL
ncbi:FAD-dependent monooxygenase [Teratosphaeria destructans]|uniref:FAD-dependent monooxygenase n=1 Tax=Teratosphaeria destructans TaxID=418781 RepID=A0A9W7STJ1_9PEZI|nr:FAD-dependent monooxygenase [Teratosphaeria destructans]